MYIRNDLLKTEKQVLAHSLALQGRIAYTCNPSSGEENSRVRSLRLSSAKLLRRGLFQANMADKRVSNKTKPTILPLPPNQTKPSN